MREIRFISIPIPICLLAVGWLTGDARFITAAWVFAAFDLLIAGLLAGFRALNKHPDAFMVAGPFSLLVPIWWLWSQSVKTGQAANIVEALRTMLVLNVIICILGTISALVIKTRLLGWVEANWPTKATRSTQALPPPVISQDELDRREAVKALLVEIRNGRA